MTTTTSSQPAYAVIRKREVTTGSRG